MTSEANVGDMAVQTETSCQYSVTFNYHTTDGSSGKAYQNCIWHESPFEKRHVTEFYHAEKMSPIDTSWTFMETKQWMREQWGGECCVSAVATVTVGSLYYYRFLLA